MKEVSTCSGAVQVSERPVSTATLKEIMCSNGVQPSARRVLNSTLKEVMCSRAIQAFERCVSKSTIKEVACSGAMYMVSVGEAGFNVDVERGYMVRSSTSVR